MSNKDRTGRHRSDRPYAIAVSDLQARLRRNDHGTDPEPSPQPSEDNDNGNDYDGGGSAA
ncbi:hypothetical protein [Nocardia sp. XZ_19_369]|uniref:hypothetical protein n=1 Tax=Nocardia sp. XZ_19_369 TaxID=2769487 RepID=UPI00188DC79D|nr:hypothetical protein [Nocardia sp. XZ_19_369]